MSAKCLAPHLIHNVHSVNVIANNVKSSIVHDNSKLQQLKCHCTDRNVNGETFISAYIEGPSK